MPTTKSHGNRLKSVTTLDKLDVANFFTPTHVQRERNLRTQVCRRCLIYRHAIEAVRVDMVDLFGVTLYQLFQKQLFSFAGSEYASTVETRRESVVCIGYEHRILSPCCFTIPRSRTHSPHFIVSLQMMSQSSVPTFPMVCDRDPRLLTICYDPVRAFCERMNALCNAPIEYDHDKYVCIASVYDDAH